MNGAIQTLTRGSVIKNNRRQRLTVNASIRANHSVPKKKPDRGHGNTARRLKIVRHIIGVKNVRPQSTEFAGKETLATSDTARYCNTHDHAEINLLKMSKTEINAPKRQ
jgi:hypothetical protein